MKLGEDADWIFQPFHVRMHLVGNGRVLSCASTICGYKIKDKEIKNIRDYFNKSPVIIPSQYIEQREFNQPANNIGINCNSSFPMNSCTNMIFLFPRTTNQLTVSMNPYQNNLQYTISNKPYPDVAVDTTSARHAEMMLENAWLDSFFQQVIHLLIHYQTMK
jgi:hypothetical protein